MPKTENIKSTSSLRPEIVVAHIQNKGIIIVAIISAFVGIIGVLKSDTGITISQEYNNFNETPPFITTTSFIDTLIPKNKNNRPKPLGGTVNDASNADTIIQSGVIMYEEIEIDSGALSVEDRKMLERMLAPKSIHNTNKACSAKVIIQTGYTGAKKLKFSK